MFASACRLVYASTFTMRCLGFCRHLEEHAVSWWTVSLCVFEIDRRVVGLIHAHTVACCPHPAEVSTGARERIRADRQTRKSRLWTDCEAVNARA